MNFYQRFDIKMNLAEAQKKFVNRASNLIFEDLYYHVLGNPNEMNQMKRLIASAIGEKFYYEQSLDDLLHNDFHRCLRAIETFFKFAESEDVQQQITGLVEYALEEAETDLGIGWHDGIFTHKGAKLLDDSLVNESLHWLADSGYESVRKPFEKALHHLLGSGRHPEVLSDVVTDAYESLEALAKIVTGKTSDLSKNRELFLSQVNASGEFKDLLKQYIEFANEFRHGADPRKPKPILTEPEVEFFVYTTGAFIRMAKESAVEKK